MELEEALSKALSKANLVDLRVELEATATGRVGGVLVSPSFSGLPQHERQAMIWDHLETLLSPEQLLQVISLITLTPREMDEAA